MGPTAPCFSQTQTVLRKLQRPAFLCLHIIEIASVLLPSLKIFVFFFCLFYIFVAVVVECWRLDFCPHVCLASILLSHLYYSPNLCFQCLFSVFHLQVLTLLLSYKFPLNAASRVVLSQHVKISILEQHSNYQQYEGYCGPFVCSLRGTLISMSLWPFPLNVRVRHSLLAIWTAKKQGCIPL